MGTYVLFNACKAIVMEKVKDVFNFGFVLVKQANAPPDWFHKEAENFKASGSKLVKAGNRVVVTFHSGDLQLMKLEKVDLATKIYGHNHLGIVGPGDIEHIPNMLAVAVKDICPKLDPGAHTFHKNPNFVKFIKSQMANSHDDGKRKVVAKLETKGDEKLPESEIVQVPHKQLENAKVVDDGEVVGIARKDDGTVVGITEKVVVTKQPTNADAELEEGVKVSA